MLHDAVGDHVAWMHNVILPSLEGDLMYQAFTRKSHEASSGNSCAAPVRETLYRDQTFEFSISGFTKRTIR